MNCTVSIIALHELGPALGALMRYSRNQVTHNNRIVKAPQNNQRQTPQKIKVNLSVLPAAVMLRTPHTQYPQISSSLTLGGDYPHTWLKLKGEGYMKDWFLEHHWKYHPISPNTFSAAHEETKTLLRRGVMPPNKPKIVKSNTIKIRKPPMNTLGVDSSWVNMM